MKDFFDLDLGETAGGESVAEKVFVELRGRSGWDKMEFVVGGLEAISRSGGEEKRGQAEEKAKILLQRIGRSPNGQAFKN